MILYDGIYSWSGKTSSGKRPVSWWPGSYRVKIVDLSDTTPDGVFHIKPVICLFADTGKGFNVRNHFQYFAQSICQEFGLTLNKVLWVEYYPEGTAMDVATLNEGAMVGKERLYTVHWRPVHEDEAQLIGAHKGTTNGLFA
ncbi:hypothetical protein [Desulfoluna butyratoxydans]|uniref:Uncharacterized protein n=1 Tax=Desulfoluna butyratoxydans TaxID=231438 RepID=A0A4U8YIN7_9BACT|nr:hypothetical protein [Desulfoluna butyratoxydans]VFQ42829.1 hypothetical protein MSL71_4500 [Desulfoluna butyratoxydans]